MFTVLLFRPLLALLAALMISGPIAQSGSAQVDQNFLDDLAAAIDLEGIPGSIMIAVYEPDGTVISTDRSEISTSDTLASTAAYRIGSITKTFTSALVMMLVDDGVVDLDASAADYITRIPIPEAITVRQLLNHTSGLAEYVDYDDLAVNVMGDPARIWTPEEIWALIEDEPVGKAGVQFNYASTNYIALGVLIEEVTGQTYADVLSERIIEPLGLDQTYLAGFQNGEEPADAYLDYSGVFIPVVFDYTAIATIAWSAGGLVSTGVDLHAFMTALFAGEIVSDEALAEMTDTGEHDYGLGLAARPDAPGFYGHAGLTPGYSTLIAFSPETGEMVFWAATNEAIDFGSTVSPILKELSATAI